jgi:hypothetical protein
MQYKSEFYNEKEHDKFTALTVKQPYASKLVLLDDTIDGINYGLKSIEVRSRNTEFRGEIIITSSAQPKIYGYESGVIVGKVELYDVKPLHKLTEEEWDKTCIPKEERKGLHGFGWMMRNPKRLIEFPVSGKLGLWKLVFTKDIIVEYPELLKIDKESYKILINEKSSL